ncbi:MAG: hypothetical protein COV67_00260 [Nitrospinae bacterium CG11_big_fil_rev_8_21_14_0_20_56_8]|nr:MAG: hypothetical protein COV67_00260 [Nitrospinae bacterium CG11_big_fil_rev_8_21_14_0_20_56_8]
MLHNLESVMGLVAPSFIIIAMGFIYGKLTRSDTSEMVHWTMIILVPSFAFYHILKMEIEIQLVSSIFLTAWIVILGNGLLSFILFRFFPVSSNGLFLPIMFMNTVNLPFPILLAAYGPDALSLSLMFYFASLVGIFTVGILIVSAENAATQIFKEPVLYVLVAGFFIKYNEIPMPQLAMDTLALLEKATVPVVLLALGMQLSWVKVTELKLPLLATAIRFLGGLGIALLCVKAFGLAGLPRKVALFISVMPSAVISYLVAQKYDAGGSLVASTVFLSTLFSILLIPAMLLWLG